MLKRVPFTPGNLTDHQFGTDDVLVGLDTSTNILIGDAGGSMFDFSRGGNDTFTGGNFSATNIFFGDAAGSLFDFAQGGDDTFTGGGASTNTAYGDAGGDMSDHSKGGTILSPARAQTLSMATRVAICRTSLKAGTTPSLAPFSTPSSATQAAT